MDERFQSYIILGVLPGASADELRQAYWRLAREWHPDRITSDERKRRHAEARLREINRAYELLEREADSPAPDSKAGPPDAPGYNPYEWRQSVAEQAAKPNQAREGISLYDRALKLHFEGMEHARTAHWREAVSSLCQSVYLVQKNPEAYVTLGRCYRRMGLTAKAEAAYKEAVRIAPADAETRYELAEVLVSLGDIRAAEREQARLATAAPELAELLERIHRPLHSAGVVCSQ